VTTRSNPSTALRGLILDWGGVLTAPMEGATRAWARRDGVDVEHFREIMRAWVAPSIGASIGGLDSSSPDGSPVHRLERGELALEDFEAELATALTERGSPVEARGLVRRVLGDLTGLDEAMLAMVARARSAGLATALLSNSWGNHYPEELMDGLFDAVVISGRVGMRKPELRIYRHTAGLLGLPPVECVMVDDLPHNVRAAAQAGMVGVLHRDYEQTRDELEILFGLTLA
jgi:putative hydrolase of the HAD superfamily